MDYLATTPVDRRVLDAMLPYFCEQFGNASSATHALGNDAAMAVAQARRQVAALLNAREREIVFTSGATEANNLALKGVAEFVGRGHIITAQTEHKAVLDVCKSLARRGFSTTYLDVDQSGSIDVDALERAITDETVMVSLMAANNEVGTLHPLAEIGALCKARGVLFHCDAAQAVGKIEIDVDAQGIDLLSLSAHKFYGPKGVGALYVRSRSPRVRLGAQQDGGGQERGLRAGTLNVPGIVGLGAACQLANIADPISLKCHFHDAQASRQVDTMRTASKFQHPPPAAPDPLSLIMSNFPSICFYCLNSVSALDLQASLAGCAALAAPGRAGIEARSVPSR